MMDLDEPRVYKISKNKLTYSILIIFLVAAGSFSDYKEFFVGWLVFLSLFALFLFVPFVYKLIVSDEAISSINLFRTQTLEWNEISEIQFKSGGILLKNSDDSIKVLVKSQIDDFPEVVKLIQYKRSHLWKSHLITEFHQRVLENVLVFVMGLAFILFTLQTFFVDGFSKNDIFPVLGMMAFFAFLVWFGVSKIHKVFIDGDTLIVKYLFWNRKYHVSKIASINLQQKMEKNLVRYPVYIYLKNGKKIVLESTKEGNPILLNALEQWLEIHQKNTSQISSNTEIF